MKMKLIHITIFCFVFCMKMKLIHITIFCFAYENEINSATHISENLNYSYSKMAKICLTI